MLVGLLLLVVVISSLVMHQPRPSGETGEKADLLAWQMLDAVNKEAWDTTRYLGWTFMGMHDFQWDRRGNLVDVRWKANRVLLYTPNQKGIAWVEGKRVEGEKAEKLVRQAWNYFCNDSFWLVAFEKVFDPGTKRAIVHQKDGSQGLLVTYTAGGVTPGDSYLWLLEKGGRPKAWKMWVSVLPIGGIRFSWENWTQLPTGAWVASDHSHSLGNVALTNIRGGTIIDHISPAENPFAEAQAITSNN